jgi:hypothetical protein
VRAIVLSTDAFGFVWNAMRISRKCSIGHWLMRMRKNDVFAQISYKALFKILEIQYEKAKAAPLGVLLGDMNPDLFLEGISADPATYEDFYDCIKDNYSSTYTADVRTAFLAAMQFLRKYQEDFGFELRDVIKAMDYKDFEEVFQTIKQ